MSHLSEDFADPIKKRSGWLIPLAVFVATAALSSLVFLYHLAPDPAAAIDEQPALTDSTAPVALTIGQTDFHIPSNYIVFASARQGGKMDSLDMAVLLPELQGYTLATAQEFTSNAPDSRMVSLTVRQERRTLSEQERLQRIYMPQFASPVPRSGPAGLSLYLFRSDSGYRNEELYVGDTGEGLVLLRCTKQSPDVPSPSCLGNSSLNAELTVTYRFKRTQLDRWREISAGIEALIGAFMDRS